MQGCPRSARGSRPGCRSHEESRCFFSKDGHLRWQFAYRALSARAQWLIPLELLCSMVRHVFLMLRLKRNLHRRCDPEFDGLGEKG